MHSFVIGARWLRSWSVLFVLCLSTSTTWGQAAVNSIAKLPDSLTSAEFSRLSRELSEEGGYFPSDNFTSNETSYLTITDKLRELKATGGAYIGVGPEQNFSYIAKVRPRIAFIVDIRRQAIIQHLMYKAIFHHAASRAEFLAFLLSRSWPKDKAPKVDATISELVTALASVTSDEKTFAENLSVIKKTITNEFQFALDEADVKSLEYVYQSFRSDGFEIGFRLNRGGNRMPPPPGGFGGTPNGPNGGRWGRFPTFKELLTQSDLNGKPGNFLASNDDYEFVRSLHRKNLIIPVVGDFAGKKALAGVGDYLRKHGQTVTAFYTSNVEMVLFQNGIFEGYAANIKKLPVTERSLIIRAAFSRYEHPARLEGHSTFTLLQLIPLFIKDYDAGRHTSYVELIGSNYIAADKPTAR